MVTIEHKVLRGFQCMYSDKVSRYTSKMMEQCGYRRTNNDIMNYNLTWDAYILWWITFVHH